MLDICAGRALACGMKTAREIIDHFGRPAIAAKMGVTESAVKNAYLADKIPAAWFDAMESMAGMALPRECFSFKNP